MVSEQERFWKHVDQSGDCWLWTGGTNGRYGLFNVRISPGRWTRVYAHRYSFAQYVGDLPERGVVNHLCITPLCVRPDHLEAATYSENTRYGDGPAARKARQTHCIHGHPFDEQNTYIKKNGSRMCVACNRASIKRSRERRKSSR